MYVTLSIIKFGAIIYQMRTSNADSIKALLGNTMATLTNMKFIYQSNIFVILQEACRLKATLHMIK